MKNWLLTGVLAILTITLICCNQQEDVTLKSDLNGIESLELGDINGSDAMSEEEVATFSLGENYDGEETSEDAAKLQLYCVYKITTLDADCSRFKIGDRLCINCPNNNRCPGDFWNPTAWKYLGTDETCSGTWQRVFPQLSCTGCVEGGQRGYEFID